jgi:predicted permease
MLTGFLLKRGKLLPDNSAQVLSKLEMLVILPALNYKVFAANFNRAVLREMGGTMLWGLVLLSIVFALALLLSRFFAKDRNTRDIYTYSFTIPNYGYVGYALMAALYGETMLFRMMIFVLPISVFTYTIGMYLLLPYKTITWKRLLNPSFLGILLGLLVGLFEIPMPAVITQAAASASACMAPLAMILTGFVIGSQQIKTLLTDTKVYIACAFRLLILPGLALILFRMIPVPRELAIIVVVYLSMPMGLNTIVFPESAGADSSVGAKMALISNVAGLFTIPLMLSLLG